MKSTGIIRRIDELGRIVIPKELRKKLEINIKDPMEIFVDGHSITLKKVCQLFETNFSKKIFTFLFSFFPVSERGLVPFFVRACDNIIIIVQKKTRKSKNRLDKVFVLLYNVN